MPCAERSSLPGSANRGSASSWAVPAAFDPCSLTAISMDRSGPANGSLRDLPRAGRGKERGRGTGPRPLGESSASLALLDLQHAGQTGVVGRVEAVDRSPAVDEALDELDLLRVREDVVDLVVEIVDRIRPTDQERVVETATERVRGAPLGEPAGGQRGVRVAIAVGLDGVVVRVHVTEQDHRPGAVGRTARSNQLSRLSGTDVALAERRSLVGFVAARAVERLEVRVHEVEALSVSLHVDRVPPTGDVERNVDRRRETDMQQRAVCAAGRVLELDPGALPNEDRVAHRQALVVIRSGETAAVAVVVDRKLCIELRLDVGEHVADGLLALLPLLLLALVHGADEIREEVTSLWIGHRCGRMIHDVRVR